MHNYLIFILSTFLINVAHAHTTVYALESQLRIPYQFDSTKPLPNENTPIISLGLWKSYRGSENTSVADVEAVNMTKALNHSVITWHQFPDVGYKDMKLNFTIIEDIQNGIEEAMRRSPGVPVVIVRLDGFKLKGLMIDPSNDNPSYTNSEIKLILENSKYFKVTRWILNKKELENSEVINFFNQYRDKFSLTLGNNN